MRVRSKDKLPYPTILKTLIGTALFLIIDSPTGDSWFSGYGQEVAVILVGFAFAFSYWRSSKRARQVMIIGIAVGLTGEYILSIVLGMYHYRFYNIPLWLIFGHSLIFASVFRLSHHPYILYRQEIIKKWLLIFSVVYSFVWLYWANDWFGFFYSVVFFVILYYAKNSRLFFLIMFFIVAYLEQIGTATGTWYWPEIAFGKFEWLPSGNPPVGIAAFYFLFDAIVLFFYLNVLHPKVKEQYRRMKATS
jgi:hypothetical protein